ncbi:MAG: NADPH-dependent FMN reductase [Candidatus Woesearchaeota archaeon]
MAKITIFLSSTRNESNGLRVYSWIEKVLTEKGYDIVLVNPQEQKSLQVFSERYDKSEGRLIELKKISDGIRNSKAIIIIAAEYNHTITGALKNALDTFYPEYKNKVFGIISYSTGRYGGIRANEQLRMIIPALGGIVIPKTIMISNVKESFDEEGNVIAEEYNDRLEAFINSIESLSERLS